MKNYPTPEGFHTITPNLVCRGCEDAIQFYEEAFGAIRVGHPPARVPSGRIMHAEIRIGDSIVFLCDEMPEFGMKAHPTSLYAYVPDVDAAYDQAIRAGCTPGRPVSDMFWGDRMGMVTDPYGHSWTLASRVREVTAEELKAEQEKASGVHEAAENST